MLAVLGLSLAPDSAALTEAQEVSDARIAELLAQAQAQVQLPAPASSPTVALAIDEAVRRGLERNLDLNLERLNPRLVDLQVAGILATYQPTVTSSFVNQSQVRLPTSQLQGVGLRINTDTLQWNSGVSQSVPWYGGSFFVNFNNSRDETNDQSALRNPGYSTNLIARYKQPLLRNLKTDSTRNSLQKTRISQQVADINLRATIVNTEASIRNA
ncbi:MAG: hypothetical protein HY654_07725, partial [Acidobacteria bacterium]|nr:hypothetical protein [Acidobacteriota bacterium]